MIDVALIIIAVVIFVPLGFIYQTYIVEPKKSFLEGFLDWIHESDEDI